MQSGSTNNNHVQRQIISTLPQSKDRLKVSKNKSQNRSDTTSQDIGTEITKSLLSVTTARKAAGENRGGSVSKVAMYTAAILNELNRKSEKTGAKFLQRFETNLVNTKQSNAEAIKPAAHQALNDLVRAGVIRIEEAKQATHAAWKMVYKDLQSLQLKTSATPVRASSNILHARTLSSAAPASHATGDRSEHVSRSINAPAGFLWKPVSDSAPHGLAVLLPASWTGKIGSLEIVDPESGDVLAVGPDGGVGNGDRQHFRFKQQGAAFPDGAIVRVHLNDGSVRDIAIENTSSRVEGR